MLSINAIGKSINGKVLFEKLGITLAEGSILVVKGENGSGKTSLLKILAGLMRLDTGSIEYAGENVFEHYEEYCDMICYVAHKNAVNPHLTVYENLKFWADMYDTKNAIDAALEYFLLEKYKDFLVANLSAGLARRVALSRLLLSDSEIWLLDEPLSNLDIDSRKMLCDLISTKCQNKGICIISTHDPIEISNVIEISLEDYKK